MVPLTGLEPPHALAWHRHLPREDRPEGWHALLLAIARGCREKTGALRSTRALDTAVRLARRARADDPVRARFALAEVDRLPGLWRAIDGPGAATHRVVGTSHTRQVRALRGVGALVAAKLLGEVLHVEALSQHRRFRRAGRHGSSAGLAHDTAPAPSQPTRQPAAHPTLLTPPGLQVLWHAPDTHCLARTRTEGKWGVAPLSSAIQPPLDMAYCPLSHH